MFGLSLTSTVKQKQETIEFQDLLIEGIKRDVKVMTEAQQTLVKCNEDLTKLSIGYRDRIKLLTTKQPLTQPNTR